MNTIKKIRNKWVAILLALLLVAGINPVQTTFAADVDAAAALTKTLAYLKTNTANPAVSSIGGEWAVLSLARSGVIDADSPITVNYLANLDSALAGSAISGATDYERVALALSSLGIDASNYKGINLTEFAKKGNPNLINAKVFGLLALNAKPYTGDKNAYISSILAASLAEGGWVYGGVGSANADLSAMALQALAPYYKADATASDGERAVAVKTAVDKALTALKKAQDPSTGGFSGKKGVVSTCSTAQVVTALTALGINPESLSWQTANGKTPLTALLTNYASAGTFGELDTVFDRMATEQAAYALVAHSRYVNGESPLYIMYDAFGELPPDIMNEDADLFVGTTPPPPKNGDSTKLGNDEGTTTNNDSKVKLSKDAKLKKLSVNSGKLTPKFKASVKSYKLKLSAKKSAVKITPKKNFAKAKVQIRVGTGKFKTVKSVNVKVKKAKSKIVTIRVTAENGAKKDYKIKVSRAKK
jgi:hypothetical protein